MSKAIHFRGLNGLRAIAALSVVVTHVIQSLDHFNLNPYMLGKTYEGDPKGFDLGGYGVSIFFALSGFLITYLLLAEKAAGSINVKHFYIRRILRIHPLYFAYMLIAIGVAAYLGEHISISSLLFYIFFAANVPFIFGPTLPFLGHYWSLAVEEQFYIFYPFIVRHAKKLLLTLFWLTGVLIVIKVGLRLGEIRYGNHPAFDILDVARFQCMLIGAMAAKLYYDQNTLFIKISTHLLAQILSWGVILLSAFNRFHFLSVIDQEVVSVITVCLIMGQITRKNYIIDLENRLCDLIGKISYGIYVVHPLVILLCATFLADIHMPDEYKFAIILLTVIGITICIAWLSYTFFEKRFLKLKAGFTKVKSSPTREE